MAQRGLAPAETRGAVQQQTVPACRIEGDWLRFPRSGLVWTRAPFAPDDEPAVLDALLDVHTPEDVEQFACLFGPLGWDAVTSAIPDSRASVLLRQYRQETPAHEFGEPVAWVRQHAAILRWVQTAWKAQQDAAPRVLPLAAVEPCPSPIAALEMPVVPVAVAHILDAHVGHVRRVVTVHLQRAALAVGWHGRALVDTCYALMAERLQSPHARLVPCKVCGRIIHAADPRRQYCPPKAWKLHGKNKAHSSCYEKHSKRRYREQLRAKGLTSRGTPRKRQPASAEDSTSRAPVRRGTRKR